MGGVFARLGWVGRGVRHIPTLCGACDVAVRRLPAPTSASGRLPGPAGQPTVKVLPLTVMVFGVSPVGAGPDTRSPVAASKWLWWHGQMIWPPSTEPTMQPWCGQTASKALKAPAVGWVTTVLVSAKTLPPPTGMSDVGVPEEAAPDGDPPVLGTGGLLQAARAP